MKKHLRRLAIVLALAICLPSFAACDISSILGSQLPQDPMSSEGANQDQQIEVSGEGLEMTLNSDSSSYSVNGYKGNSDIVYIPAEHEGLPVTGIGAKAFMSKSMTAVVIPDSVTVIGNSAFKNCTKLEAVTIGANGSMLEKIDNQAFFGCNMLDNINFAGDEDIWNAVEKGKDWDKHVGMKTDDRTYTLHFVDLPVPTETETAIGGEIETLTPADSVPETNDISSAATESETKATEVKTDEAETESESKEFELELPAFGIIAKKHDPTLQVWSETLGAYKVHLGIDIEAFEGAPVVAAADGVISKIWDDALMGKCVAINHGNGIFTFYKNLDPDLSDGIEENAEIKCGQHIGRIGCSAIVELADEPHLHFEMTVDGISVNPEDYFSDNAKDILASGSNWETNDTEETKSEVVATEIETEETKSETVATEVETEETTELEPETEEKLFNPIKENANLFFDPDTLANKHYGSNAATFTLSENGDYMIVETLPDKFDVYAGIYRDGGEYVSGQYIVVKYRMAASERNDTMQFFTATAPSGSFGPNGHDSVYASLVASGDWCTMVIDASTYHDSFIPDDDGQYRISYLRVDYYASSQSMDVAFIAVCDDFNKAVTLDPDTDVVRFYSKGHNVEMYDPITGERYSECGHLESDLTYYEAKAPTCTETGWEAYVACTKCDYTTCVEKAALGHTYVGDICSLCGETKNSEELAFISNGDGTCYVSGIGDCEDTTVVIPRVSPNGDIVTGIGEDAFYCCVSIKSVILPECITSIGIGAFSSCDNLESINIPEGVTSIGYCAFKGCLSLTSITIPESVRTINEFAFHYCINLESVTLNGGITSISNGAFYDCSSLTSITIPEGVTSIGDEAFHGCSSLETVYYTGTEEEWAAITINSGNDDLTYANVIFNYGHEE